MRRDDERLLAVGSTVCSMALSYSQLPALREFPVGLAEAVHHRTLGCSLGHSVGDEHDSGVPAEGAVL